MLYLIKEVLILGYIAVKKSLGWCQPDTVIVFKTAIYLITMGAGVNETVGGSQSYKRRICTNQLNAPSTN